MKEAVFRILWAASAIFHQVSFAGFTVSLRAGNWFSFAIDIAINLTACFVVSNPKRNFWFGALLVGVIARFLYDLPFVSNHLQLQALCSTAILLELALRRPLPIGSLQLSTIIIYFYAALHKINFDWLSLPGSCASNFGRQIFETFLPLNLSQFVLGFLPVTIICIEGVLAILLISKRLRTWGVVLGVILHLFLGLDLERRFYNFSTLMFSLLFLFVSESFVTSAVEFSRKTSALSAVLRILSKSSFRAAAAVTLFFLQLGLMPESDEWLRILCFRAIVFIWFALSLVLTSVVIHIAPNDRQDSNPNFKLDSGLLLPLLIFVIGLGPYLGFRTRLAWDMYSNLKVENGQSNHLFLPSLDLWGYLSDTVTITETSDPAVQAEYKEQNLEMVGLEFDRYRLAHPIETVGYVRHQREKNSTLAEKDSISLVVNKLMFFRPADLTNSPRCQW